MQTKKQGCGKGFQPYQLQRIKSIKHPDHNRCHYCFKDIPLDNYNQVFCDRECKKLYVCQCITPMSYSDMLSMLTEMWLAKVKSQINLGYENVLDRID
jgi:hypothetical protein